MRETVSSGISEVRGGIPAAPSRKEESLPYWDLLFRETIGIEVLAAVLVCIALLVNAPLEQLADPQHTASPAKAPWYFTGLQELLHYFPPFVAGIILPTLIVLALIVVPFFHVNIKDESLWHQSKSKRLAILGIVVAGLTIVLARAEAYDALLPVWIVGVLMGLSAKWAGREAGGFRTWLSAKPVSFWIMTWFLMEAVVLTAVGALFRGPGWVLMWPGRNN
jgi:hypothetical protein